MPLFLHKLLSVISSKELNDAVLHEGQTRTEDADMMEYWKTNANKQPIYHPGSQAIEKQWEHLGASKLYNPPNESSICQLQKCYWYSTQFWA